MAKIKISGRSKKNAIVGEYVIVVEESGSVRVFRTYDNTKGALREIAEAVDFDYDPGWTTRQLDRKSVV